MIESNWVSIFRNLAKKIQIRPKSSSTRKSTMVWVIVPKIQISKADFIIPVDHRTLTFTCRRQHNDFLERLTNKTSDYRVKAEKKQKLSPNHTNFPKISRKTERQNFVYITKHIWIFVSNALTVIWVCNVIGIFKADCKRCPHGACSLDRVSTK